MYYYIRLLNVELGNVTNKTYFKINWSETYTKVTWSNIGLKL